MMTHAHPVSCLGADVQRLSFCADAASGSGAFSTNLIMLQRACVGGCGCWGAGVGVWVCGRRGGLCLRACAAVHALLARLAGGDGLLQRLELRLQPLLLRLQLLDLALRHAVTWERGERERERERREGEGRRGMGETTGGCVGAHHDGDGTRGCQTTRRRNLRAKEACRAARRWQSGVHKSSAQRPT